MPATIEIIDQQDGTGVQLQVSGLVDTPLVFWYGANEMEPSGSAFGNSVTINTYGNVNPASDEVAGTEFANNQTNDGDPSEPDSEAQDVVEAGETVKQVDHDAAVDDVETAEQVGQ